MKICALTMVYRDHWALSQWYMHYSSQLGAKNLFVIAHGRDDKIQNICPEANVITIPRDELDRFDYVRAKIMNDFHSTLTDEYDWTIRTDADELICLDPSHYSSFVELLSKRWGPAVFALGFELVEEQGQTPVPMDTCVFNERTAALFTGHYSKAWAFRQDARALRHGMEVGKKRASGANFAMPEGVYLAHLKFADTAALEKQTHIAKKWQVQKVLECQEQHGPHHMSKTRDSSVGLGLFKVFLGKPRATRHIVNSASIQFVIQIAVL